MFIEAVEYDMFISIIKNKWVLPYLWSFLATVLYLLAKIRGKR